MGGGRGTTFVYFKNTYCSIEIPGNTIKIERPSMRGTDQVS